MGPIEKAIEEFRRTRIDVYKADQVQIVRDARSAERATRDHVGRWLFELLQNCDDAKASRVLILAEEEAVYVADNGGGLKPEAVSAICGTDFSDKTTGTIGRKGVGFKSVYEISSNPQVLTVNGEGVEFSQNRAGIWLRDNCLYDQCVPHQWIPFFVPWDEARRQHPALSKLSDYRTVVRLPYVSTNQKQKIEQVLKEWPPHALFAFRHVREIQSPSLLKIALNPDDDIWELRDSRNDAPTQWQVARHCERAPENLTATLGADERQAISEGVGFLIAAPLDNNCTTPTDDYLPIHVFYPTEQKGPVRLLLHAEFLVKSDRTALIPIEDSPFNAWVAERLAFHACHFVQGAYLPKKPSCHVALLVPFEDKDSHPVAASLWAHIARQAQERLRLADVDGNQQLAVSDAKMLSVSVEAGRARRILKATELRQALLHSAFDNDKEARKALKALKCQEIRDEDLVKAIAERTASEVQDREWLWDCWEWLAAWVAAKPYGEEHEKRIQTMLDMPVVPVSGGQRKASDLKDRIATWRSGESAESLPEWLPLTFVDDWFRDRVAGLRERSRTSDSPVMRLLKEIGIRQPGSDVVRRAVGQGIAQYWKNKQGDPGRFLRYILEQDWHQTAEPTDVLPQCPVPAAHEGADGITWVEARAAYFGERWGNNILDKLYKGNSDVPWAHQVDSARPIETQLAVLAWLGVAHCPRVLEDRDEKQIGQLSEDCKDWKGYLKTAQDNCGRQAEKIRDVAKLDCPGSDELDMEQVTSMIFLLAKNWNGYYRSRTETEAYGTRGQERYYRPWPVKAMWWYEVCEKLVPPTRHGYAKRAALTKCWLPDKRTERVIGDLLPCVDTAAFMAEQEVVRQWLEKDVGLRTHIEQLEPEEWRTILSERIPQIAPAQEASSNEQLRGKVTQWYEACLDAARDNDHIREGYYGPCPVLCRKGREWKYIKDEPRYLNDDRDLAAAFQEDMWLVNVSARLKSEAGKYLCIPPLSGSTRLTPEIPNSKQELVGEILEKFKATLPYVYAERYKIKEHRDNPAKLKDRLQSLTLWVVPELRSNVELNGVTKSISRPFIVQEERIFLCKENVGEPVVAQALAEVLDVRSEADFYENLLRCKDDGERKAKLLAKGLAEADIMRVREFHEVTPEEEPEMPPAPAVWETPTTIAPLPPGQGTDKALPTTPSKTTPFPAETSGSRPEPQSEPPPATPQPEEEPLELVEAGTAEYKVGIGREATAGSSGAGGSGGDTPRPSLSQNQKNEIEKCGRAIARRELERMGCEVEEMPLDNPGFDLKATQRSRRELRIEVKAHLGRASVVELTTRQYREYLGSANGEYDWQLWNVEHLRKNDESSPSVTKYQTIPEEALNDRTFSVNLRECSPYCPT